MASCRGGDVVISAADDTPAGDLDEAERFMREMVAANRNWFLGQDRARTLLAEYDRRAQEIERLRGHILDIDAHATPDGDVPDDPGYTTPDPAALIAAAFAYADGTSEANGETPTEVALLDAIADYRAALAGNTTEENPDA